MLIRTKNIRNRVKRRWIVKAKKQQDKINKRGDLINQVGAWGVIDNVEQQISRRIRIIKTIFWDCQNHLLRLSKPPSEIVNTIFWDCQNHLLRLSKPSSEIVKTIFWAFQSHLLRLSTLDFCESFPKKPLILGLLSFRLPCTVHCKLNQWIVKKLISVKITQKWFLCCACLYRTYVYIRIIAGILGSLVWWCCHQAHFGFFSEIRYMYKGGRNFYFFKKLYITKPYHYHGYV
jgi:hypothetical protein